MLEFNEGAIVTDPTQTMFGPGSGSDDETVNPTPTPIPEPDTGTDPFVIDPTLVAMSAEDTSSTAELSAAMSAAPVPASVAAHAATERKLTAAKAKRLANRLAAQRIRDSLFLVSGENTEVPWFDNLSVENRRMVLSALEGVARRLDDASI